MAGLVGIAVWGCTLLSFLFAHELIMGMISMILVGFGLGGGLFAVATLTAAMTLPMGEKAGQGLALGAWGAAQATAAGLAIALGGTIRDGVGALAASGAFGETLNTPGTGYSVVYHTEIALLFATLVVLGPLVRLAFLKPQKTNQGTGRIGLADFPT